MTRPWPRARAVAGDRAVIKAAADDFQVCEITAEAPTGDGEHLWLHVEKRDLSTPETARWLAAAFSVPEVAVGYAGMKDKRAVTRQWFSIHTRADACPPQHEGVRVLQRARHRRKLRRGELTGNRFRIRLTRVAGEAWPGALADAGERGVPNYFGAQRFGGDNLAAARSWLADRRRRRVSAFRRGLHLSVLRSFLFNEVLAARVLHGTWHSPLEGDVLTAPAGGAGDVPTGPLWGRGRPPVSGPALALETAVLEPHRALCDGLEHAGLSQERRSLVLYAPDLAWREEGDALVVTFTLPPGTYATSLLGEIFDLEQPAT